MGENLFKKYYKKMAVQGLLKSLLLGLIVGFSAMLICSFVSWLVSYSFGYWISIILLGALTLIATPIFYMMFYKPDTKKIARRIDECGLEERMITMTEYANDQSYIAKRQRADALNALEKVNTSLLKFAVAFQIIIVLAIVSVLGTGMTIVSGLSSNGIVPDGSVLLPPSNDDTPDVVYFEVTYEVEGDGEIVGELFQLVEEGMDGTTITAEPVDGWGFSHWIVDGYEELYDDKASPTRQELEVTANMNIVAVFVEVDPSEDEGEGEGDGEGEGEGTGKPSDSTSDGQSQGDPSDGDGNGEGSGAGGSHSENNSVIDGETYYGDSTYDNANSDSQTELGGNDSVSDRDKNIISDYFDTIKN